jgi:hypothetical protein
MLLAIVIGLTGCVLFWQRYGLFHITPEGWMVWIIGGCWSVSAQLSARKR